jgi:hypothetical protein
MATICLVLELVANLCAYFIASSHLLDAQD